MTDTDHEDEAGGTDSVDRRLILMARTVVVLFREFETIARELDITIPQYRFLLFLKRGPKRAGELAVEAAIRKPTASGLIADMEKRGLITRAPDKDDGRSVKLKLTQKGLAQAPRIRTGSRPLSPVPARQGRQRPHARGLHRARLYHRRAAWRRACRRRHAIRRRHGRLTSAKPGETAFLSFHRKRSQTRRGRSHKLARGSRASEVEWPGAAKLTSPERTSIA